MIYYRFIHSQNPNYMLSNCASACTVVAEQKLKDDKELASISSFFDLSAKDIHGNVLEFAEFKGDVTIIVNVASYCGYTDSHYKQLVQLWNDVKDTGRIRLLAFPCNQFGAQEPASNNEILEFTQANYGVEFTMMSKLEVNGNDAHIVYKYLKHVAGPPTIGWNFATYFVVGPDGSVQSFSGAEPKDLKAIALDLIGMEEEL